LTNAIPLIIRESSATSSAALALTDALSARLAAITGDEGRTHFTPDASDARACFLLAMADDVAVGCGALRPLHIDGQSDTAEIKRMYASMSGRGIGRDLLLALEERARNFGYRRVVLETRRINKAAVTFYLRQGYTVCANYGPYVGRDDAVCFSKVLVSD
jgi:ribosomal protein S18 acetylase RimI-like enzyme